jgi:pSer/pThr/pTyr-binding forkhead associated (FHA) protein
LDPLMIAILRYGFLVLLLIFVAWSVNAAAVGLRVPKGADTETPPRSRRSKGSNAPTVVLVRTENKRAGSYRLREPMQIGRAEKCEINPKDDYLSQYHARIFPRDGAWLVEDLGSTNGTFLNDHKVTGPLEVHAGDDVRLGRTVLQFRR